MHDMHPAEFKAIMEITKDWNLPSVADILPLAICGALALFMITAFFSL